MKLLPNSLLEKYIFILALEMASPGNQHCAICIGTLPFPVAQRGVNLHHNLIQDPNAGNSRVAINDYAKVRTPRLIKRETANSWQ